MPTIFIHLGAHKTGSTFFQNFCVKNRLQLLLDGVYYVVGSVRDGNNTSYGNGRVLYESLKHGSPSFAGLQARSLVKILKDYGCVSGLDVLISDEDLLDIDEVCWADIKSACSGLGYRLKIILFIREPVGYYESLFSHCVKSYCEVRTPEAFVLEESWSHVHACFKLSEIFDDDELVVRSYQGDMLDQMGEVLSIDLRRAAYLYGERSVNVKMSADVIDIALRANRSGLGFLVPEMLEYLSKAYHGSHSVLRFSGNAEIISSIRSRYAGLIEDINNKYFPNDRLELPIETEKEELRRLDGQGSALDAGYDFLLSKLSDFEGSYHNLLVSKLEAGLLAMKDVDNVELPEDFSPIEYFLLNRDVLFAGADPCEHFLAYGLKEGRRYKI